jgi:uncharacterized OB-fold protein
MGQRNVAEGLLEWSASQPRLLGSTCSACGHLTFPSRAGCQRCGGERAISTALSTHGTLWTWTRQRFQPKNPPYIRRESATDFQPYAVGYIELPEGRVEARIAGDVDQELHIGMPMELTLVCFATDPDGTEVMTYAFQSASERT